MRRHSRVCGLALPRDAAGHDVHVNICCLADICRQMRSPRPWTERWAEWKRSCRGLGYLQRHESNPPRRVSRWNTTLMSSLVSKSLNSCPCKRKICTVTGKIESFQQGAQVQSHRNGCQVHDALCTVRLHDSDPDDQKL
jgi:hypothetical protein